MSTWVHNAVDGSDSSGTIFVCYIGGKANYSHDKQALDCDPEDLLMITAMWRPPFSMMVKQYCGKKTRIELESDGKRLPFPARNDIFHVWEIVLYNFDEVKRYLNEHNSVSIL